MPPVLQAMPNFWRVVYTLRFNEVERGHTGFPLSVSPFALYLQQNSPDPFYVYISYQATSQVASCVNFFFKIKRKRNLGRFLKVVSLTLSYFDLGSNMNQCMGNHGAVGVSSERRRPNCSSYISFYAKIF